MPIIEESHRWWGVAGPSTQVVENALPRIVVTEDIDFGVGWSAGPGCGGGTSVLLVTYDDTLARVVIDGSGLAPYTAVIVERSTDQMHWTTVRGAVQLTLNGDTFTHYDYEFSPGVVNYYRVTTIAPSGCETASASVTPDLTQIWIKSITRPFLNTPLGTSCSVMGSTPVELLVVANGGVTRPTRSAIYPIINRTNPVGVTDLALARSWPMRLRTFDPAGLQTLDYLFASGDTLLIQVPHNDCAETVEHGYVIVSDPTYQRHHRYRQRVVWDFGVQEVAVPGPDIGYRQATWATVLAQFGSWAGVMAACPTWAHVLALLPSPSEVIVP